MSGGPAIVTIDLGTQSLRVGVRTAAGDMLFSWQRPVATRTKGIIQEQYPAQWQVLLEEGLPPRLFRHRQRSLPADPSRALSRWTRTVPPSARRSCTTMRARSMTFPPSKALQPTRPACPGLLSPIPFRRLYACVVKPPRSSRGPAVCSMRRPS